MAQLRAVFLAPQFDLVAIRGERCVGKTWLLDKVVHGLPEGRPMVWHSAYACNTPEAARVELLHSLMDVSADGAGGSELSKFRGASSSLQSMPATGDGRLVRARVEAGELTAFSTAFQAIQEKWPAADRRIVRRARLVGLALVDRPEHEAPHVDGVPGREGDR